MSLYNHTVDVTVWDSKDKVSVKARTDRPKAFRLPSISEVDFPGRGVSARINILGLMSLYWFDKQCT